MIGLLSGVWLLILYIIGCETFFSDVLKIFISGTSLKGTGLLILTAALIPVSVLYFGLLNYKHQAKNKEITFLKAMLTCFKILIVGGLIALVFFILYFSYVNKTTLSEFVETAVAACVFGLAISLVMSWFLTAGSKRRN